jgi:hypothetical protein
MAKRKRTTLPGSIRNLPNGTLKTRPEGPLTVFIPTWKSGMPCRRLHKKRELERNEREVERREEIDHELAVNRDSESTAPVRRL